MELNGEIIHIFSYHIYLIYNHFIFIFIKKSVLQIINYIYLYISDNGIIYENIIFLICIKCFFNLCDKTHIYTNTHSYFIKNLYYKSLTIYIYTYQIMELY